MSSENPFLAANQGKKKITRIGIYIGMIGSIMVSSSISTLLPTIAADIGGTEYYSLVSTLSGPLSVCAMVIYGYLGARNPAIKRKLFCFSMLIGALVMFFRAISTSMIAIIIPGTLWGVVSAGIYVIGFSIIRDMHNAQKTGVYLGVIGIMSSIGMLAGPAITGILIDLFNWRAACHFIWPFLLIAGILVWNGVQATKEEAAAMAVKTGSFDYPGALALITFLTPLLLALSLGSSLVPFGSAASNLLFVLSVVSLIMLVLVIRKKGTFAIIPAPVLKDRNVLCLTICNLLLNFSGMAIFFFMPTYVLYIIGGTATQASLTTTMTSVMGLVLSPVLGKRIARAGNARGVLVGGTVIRIVITAAFLFLLTPTTNIVFIYVLMLFAGIYNCQHRVTFSAAPQIQIKPEIRDLGNSVIQVAQNLGAGIGTAVFTLVIGIQGVASGMKTAFVIAIATALAGLAAGLFLEKLEPETCNQAG